MSKDLVLIVDDELDNRVMMRYFLESWGYEVELAANGQEALEKVEAQPPTLVLLDLEMPVMNGFETCDRLKSNEATENIPVIMFTGLEQTADKVKGIKKGADDYVVKTVDPEELQARIEMILRRTKRYEAQPDSSNGGNGNQPQPQESHAVSGSLSELYFPETMQLIMAYGKSGVLHLRDGDRQGRVYLKEGLVVHAQLGEVEAEDAFYDLALWKSGTFSFQVGESAPKETINKSGTNLLIEATRRLDEWNMISSKIPSFEVFPTRVPLSGAKSIRLTREDWKILLLMDGQASIRQIAETSGLDLFETGRIVFNLITVGVVSIEKEATAKEEQYNQVPSLEPDLAAEEFKMNAEQWRLISQIDGQRTVGSLAGQLGIPAPTLLKVLNQLAEKGFVRMGDRVASGEKSRKIAVKKNEAAQVEQDAAAYRPRIRAVGLD
jgi:CheY-like chemotaxis protein/predicted transcriptional regulator